MGLIQKKDEKDEIDGIQIIERGEGPDGDEEEKIDLVAGTSAEHIAAGTTAEEEDARLEAKIAADAADENLMPEEQDEDDDILGSDEDDRASKHKKTMIAAFVVAVVIAAVVGFFIGNGGFGGKGVGQSSATSLCRQGRRLGDPHRGPARFDRGKLQLQRQEERHHRARGH